MKRLVGIAVAVSALLVGAGTVGAEYQPATPTLELTPSRVAPGGVVMATLRLPCANGAAISLTIDPNDGGASGGAAICSLDTATGRFTAPTRPGSYVVEAIGADGLITEATLTVTASLDGPEQPLPSTGSDQTVPIALFAASVCAGGLALLGLSRSRSRPVGA